jgi:hypothetical protein
MDNKLLRAFSFASIFALSCNATATVVVTQTDDASTLANTLLGSGITISGESYTGAAVASGTFTGGLSAGIGIESGIILTSGDASLAPGPNTLDGATGDNQLPGDTDLDTLTPDPTFDATVLEFDFETAGGDLFFRYVFASEEYNEYLFSGVTDAFGFFVDGANVALVPGTTDPININTINCGNPFGSADNNCSLYNNNDPNDPGPPAFDIEYDGFTNVFTASVLGLGAGTHHMKLVIGDAGDYVLDSAVFLEAGSFTDTNPIPEPATLTLMGLGLAGIGFARKKKLK